MNRVQRWIAAVFLISTSIIVTYVPWISPNGVYLGYRSVFAPASAPYVPPFPSEPWIERYRHSGEYKKDLEDYIEREIQAELKRSPWLKRKDIDDSLTGLGAEWFLPDNEKAGKLRDAFAAAHSQEYERYLEEQKNYDIAKGKYDHWLLFQGAKIDKGRLLLEFIGLTCIAALLMLLTSKKIAK
jgi:hypothetical protein